MLDAIKRMFGGRPPGPDWSPVSGWAKSQHYAFKLVREAEGFAIDGRFGSLPWRLEWGPPQRDYIPGRELRLRMELGLPPDLQMMVLSRSLLEALEHRTFEEFTQGNQTYMGSAVPEEMRWLAMWPPATLAGQRELRQHVAALGVDPAFAETWVEGPLARQILAAVAGLLRERPPLLMMVHRGRLYLRMALPEATSAALAEAVALFGVAAQQALRTAGRTLDERDWSNTAWQTQMPADPANTPGPTTRP